jgi:NAD(P)-dependent dehydrogenase (short-subunit alcohol dehydrogenase family)
MLTCEQANLFDRRKVDYVDVNTKNLEGRVVIVTGAGQGLGRAYALTMAAEGARVVVNDLGVKLDGEGDPRCVANDVVAEIIEAGGQAIADNHDVADFDGAQALISAAVASFGDLDVLVNNAGILRDRMLPNMSIEEWDAVQRVHLRGHFATTRHAAAYWKARTKESGRRDAAVIQTTSIAGLHGNVGQFNYGTAKAGIATMAWLGHLELNERYGVRSYAVAPSGRTRLTLGSPASVDLVAAPSDGSFDFWSPDNVAAVVAWLATSSCRAPSGAVLGVEGDTIRRYDPWRIATTLHNGSRWSIDALDNRADEFAAGFDDAHSTSESLTQAAEAHAASLKASVLS